MFLVGLQFPRPESFESYGHVRHPSSASVSNPGFLDVYLLRLHARCSSARLLSNMTATTSNVVFDDLFKINDIDKDGKKFDRGLYFTFDLPSLS